MSPRFFIGTTFTDRMDTSAAEYATYETRPVMRAKIKMIFIQVLSGQMCHPGNILVKYCTDLSDLLSNLVGKLHPQPK